VTFAGNSSTTHFPPVRSTGEAARIAVDLLR